MRLDGLAPPALVLIVAAALVAGRRLLVGRAAAGLRRADGVAVVVLMLITGAIEHQMGRPWTYRNGPVRIWSGDVASDQNSQQVADPYAFTHLTHGALFCALTRVALPTAAVPLRLLTTVGLEAAWEAYENTDTVIERYRAVTISLGYYGDSVLNSMCDIVACLIGFGLTARLPRRVTLAWVVAVEVVLAFWIRDNLTLNLLMLIAPMDAIRTWQAGA